MYKASGMQNVFEILLSDLCRTLQSENIVEAHDHVCDILLGLSCILQYSTSSSWLGQYRQCTLRALLLLHSLTLGLSQLREAGNHVTQLKLQASVLEAVGYAYSAPSENKTVAHNNADPESSSRAALMAQLTSIFPGVGNSESKLSAQVLELLVTSIHISQLFIKALPTTTPVVNSVVSETPSVAASGITSNASVIYHTTTAQLTLLAASLRAAHVVFDAAHSLAKITAKKSATKGVSPLVLRLNQRNSLLTSLESLLKDSVGLLAKRLTLVAENNAIGSGASAELPAVADGAQSSEASAIITPSSSNIVNPDNTTPSAKPSAFAKAAYRPPSQRTSAPPPGITTKPSSTENTTSLPSPPGIPMNSFSTATNNSSGAINVTSPSAKALHALREKVTQMGLTLLGSLAAHDPGKFQ